MSQHPAPGRPGRPSGRGNPPRPGDPQSLGAALSQLFAIKGFAATKTDDALAAAWRTAAGDRIADRTTVTGITRGVLGVGVSNAALLNELVAFHKGSLLAAMKAQYPHLKLRDMKFRLRSDVTKS